MTTPPAGTRWVRYSPRWEYLVALDEDWKPPPARADRLNSFGIDGWELVAVVAPRGQPPIMYFKRQQAEP